MDHPWARIHAGPFTGKMFLLMVDAHSKWLEIHVTTSATSQRMCVPHLQLTVYHSCLSPTTAQHSPVRKNGIRHVTSTAYHPATNGLVELHVAVKTFKNAMKKAIPESQLRQGIPRVLFQYRSIPHTTTGISPSELWLGRRPRSHLDQLLPDLIIRKKLMKTMISCPHHHRIFLKKQNKCHQALRQQTIHSQRQSMSTVIRHKPYVNHFV